MSKEESLQKQEANDTTHDPVYVLSNRSGRSMIAVIDTITARGGFRGEELSTIGQLRDQASQLVQMSEEYHSKG
jgi:hypothetical protein